MSTIDNAKKGMGWLSANARAACGNCSRGQQDQSSCVNCKPPLRCIHGGFITSRYAICDQYQPMFLTGGVPK